MKDDVVLILKKATSGDEAAIQSLFKLIEDQELSKEDQEEIYHYVKNASEHNASAIYLHALFYDRGFVVKQNNDMAFLLMREAHAKGHAKAAYEVGRRFLLGIGVNQQEETAKAWLELAAGSPYYVREAMYELGRIYEEGRGVTVDLQQSKVWYEKAAQKGHDLAKAKLKS